MKFNKNMIMFSISFLISYVAFSFAYAFMQLFLLNIGYSSIQIGTIISGGAIIAILAQFIVGYICDKLKTDKYVYNFTFLLLTIFVYIMYEIGHKDFYMHLLFVSLVAGFTRTLMILQETWTLEVDEECKTHFGALRAFGSVGWIIGTMAGGYIIEKYGYGFLNEIFLFLAVVNIIYCFFMEDAVKIQKENNENISLKDIKSLITSKKYIVIILIFFAFNVITTADGYIIVEKLLKIGAGGQVVGLRYSIQAFLELPLFLFGAYLVKKFGSYKLMVFAIIMYSLKMIAYAFAINTSQILLVACMQLVTYPLMMITSKIMIDDATPAVIRATGQTIASSIYLGFSMLLTPILCSFLISSFGVDISLLAIGIFAIVPLILSVLYKKL